MKNILKKIVSWIGIETYQRLLAYSILKNYFQALNSAPLFDKRELLWDAVINSHSYSEKNMVYIEFGVHEGYSINYFSRKNNHSESKFVGLDSFEGLPEDWGSVQKGTFAVNGKLPVSDDIRLTFIKGWFQNTWSILEEQIKAIAKVENLVVHYDADLYSSTLFSLTKIDTLKKSYVAIFDEFTGHETRALYNYCQSYGAEVEFLGKTLANGYPNQVACRITPSGT